MVVTLARKSIRVIRHVPEHAKEREGWRESADVLLVMSGEKRARVRDSSRHGVASPHASRIHCRVCSRHSDHGCRRGSLSTAHSHLMLCASLSTVYAQSATLPHSQRTHATLRLLLSSPCPWHLWHSTSSRVCHALSGRHRLCKWEIPPAEGHRLQPRLTNTNNGCLPRTEHPCACAEHPTAPLRRLSAPFPSSTPPSQLASARKTKKRDATNVHQPTAQRTRSSCSTLRPLLRLVARNALRKHFPTPADPVDVAPIEQRSRSRNYFEKFQQKYGEGRGKMGGGGDHGRGKSVGRMGGEGVLYVLSSQRAGLGGFPFMRDPNLAPSAPTPTRASLAGLASSAPFRCGSG